MARQRFIHPSIWNSDQFCSLTSDTARLLFIGIFSTADDAGRRKASARSLKGEIFPQDERSLEFITIALTALVEAGLVRLYKVGDEEYLDLETWARYQKPKYPTPSKLPEFPQDSPNLPGTLPERSSNVPPALEERSPTGWVGLGRVGEGRVGLDRDGMGGGAGGGTDEPIHPQSAENSSTPPGPSAPPPPEQPRPGAPHKSLSSEKPEQQKRPPPQLGTYTSEFQDILDSAKKPGTRRRKNSIGLTPLDPALANTLAPAAEEKRIAELRDQGEAMKAKAARASPPEDDSFTPPPAEEGN